MQISIKYAHLQTVGLLMLTRQGRDGRGTKIYKQAVCKLCRQKSRQICIKQVLKLGIMSLNLCTLTQESINLQSKQNL